MIKVLITADLLRNPVVNDVHTLAKSTHMQTDCTRALANVPENKKTKCRAGRSYPGVALQITSCVRMFIPSRQQQLCPSCGTAVTKSEKLHVIFISSTYQPARTRGSDLKMWNVFQNARIWDFFFLLIFMFSNSLETSVAPQPQPEKTSSAYPFQRPSQPLQVNYPSKNIYIFVGFFLNH